ncbi:hypothetical protein ACWEWU_11660 [Staphylococcus xylosus]
MKIKTKKQLNLPQMIEWGFRNNIENKSYKTNDTGGYELYFDECGTPRFSNIINKYDTFTVEEEIEITEDTVIPRILVKSNYDDTAKEYRDSKINEFVPKYTRAIYIINDDLTMTLIWRDGELVE